MSLEKRITTSVFLVVVFLFILLFTTGFLLVVFLAIILFTTVFRLNCSGLSKRTIIIIIITLKGIALGRSNYVAIILFPTVMNPWRTIGPVRRARGGGERALLSLGRGIRLQITSM